MVDSMPAKTGKVYTDHFAVATTPQMKQKAEDAATKRGVTKSVIVRWALEAWFDEHETNEAKAAS
jgi:predicted DNA-binding protein